MDPLLISGVLGVATLIVLALAILKIVALSKLVNQLSERLSGTGMTAKELADELGGSIDKAFSQYVPKPDQLAAALAASVEAAGKKQMESAETLKKSLSETAQAVSSGFGSSAEKLQAALGGMTGKLEAVLGGHAGEVQNALQGVGAQWKDQISGALSEHAAKVGEANQALAAQLDKIASLEKDIVKVLHVQETIEGAVKEIAASEEFKSTLAELRTHLQESDKLLREVAKPRTIRLVETDGEIVQA